jgi:hypothetical protein
MTIKLHRKRLASERDEERVYLLRAIFLPAMELRVQLEQFRAIRIHALTGRRMPYCPTPVIELCHNYLHFGYDESKAPQSITDPGTFVKFSVQ